MFKQKLGENHAYLLKFCMFEIPMSEKFREENIYFLWDSATVIQWGATRWQGSLNFNQSFVELKLAFRFTIDVEHYFYLTIEV